MELAVLDMGQVMAAVAVEQTFSVLERKMGVMEVVPAVAVEQVEQVEMGLVVLLVAMAHQVVKVKFGYGVGKCQD